MEKQEILTNLYTIRAGLSLISECNDKVAVREASTEEKKGEMEAHKAEGETRIVHLENDLRSREERKTAYAQQMQEQRKMIDDGKETQSLLKKATGLFAILGGGYLIYLIYTFLNGDGSDALVALIVGGLAIFAAIATCVSIQQKSEPDRRALEYNQKKLEELQKQQAQNLDPRTIESNKQEIVTIRQSLERELDEFTALSTANQTEIDVWATEAEAIFQALKQQFNDFLDYRDWDYIDLIIYHFETNRVDTMRESLLMVDTQRQNDRLVEVMQQATAMICVSLRDNIADLKTAMVSSLANLQYSISSRLDDLNTSLIGVGQGLSALRQEIRSSVSDMTNAQNMQNSLLEKSNVSSKQMADEMRKMRRLADEATARQRRNSAL